MEPMFSALESTFLADGPPGKSLEQFLLSIKFTKLWSLKEKKKKYSFSSVFTDEISIPLF